MKYICGWIHVACFFSTHAGVPKKVNFNQATQTLSNITISWDTPSSDNGAIVEYMIQYTYNNTDNIVNTTKEMYVLASLSPATEVKFSVSAISICGAVGKASTTTEQTKAIRK